MGLLKQLAQVALPAVGAAVGGPIGGAIGASLSGLIGAQSAASAARRAASTQSAAAGRAAAELAPYQQAGLSALTSQQDLLGLNGPEKQAAAYAEIQKSPAFAGLFQQGENAILQNAAATGGLRGGNIQAALAQFRPSVLNQVIGQRFDRLGGLASLGQNSAVGVGNIYQDQGAAIAGGQLQSAAAGINLGALGRQFGGAVGSIFGSGGFPGLGNNFNLGTGSGSVAGNLGGGFAPLPEVPRF